jgi:hypothetical protein
MSEIKVFNNRNIKKIDNLIKKEGISFRDLKEALNPIDVKKTLRHITKKRAYEEKKGFN